MTRESLHALVDELPEDQTDLAFQLLEDLRDAADEPGPPVGEDALASHDRGLADIKAGRMLSLDDFSRKHGL
jgi:hypothetical protein